MAKKKKKEHVEYESVEVLIEDIVKEHGDRAIAQGLSNVKVHCDAISTGALNLDLAIGVGGIPRGRIIEIFGPYASGKTTLTLEIAANAQKIDPSKAVAFIDVEHALDPNYAAALGVDVNKMLISQPDSAEQALNIVEALCASERCSLVIVDSVAALVPKAELEGNMGDSHMGLQARLLGQALRKLKGIVNQTNTALIFINQIRHKIGVMFGTPETTSGGKALPYAASVRLDIRKIAVIKDGDTPIANATRVKVVKNKVGAPFKQAEFDIVYGKGINRIGCLLDTGVTQDIISKRGSNYYYGDVRLGNGRVAACKALETSDLTEEIENKILSNECSEETNEVGFTDES